MRFFETIFVLLGSIALVAAQANPISEPTAETKITAGESTTIKWTPTSSGTITLTLRKGSSTDLKDVEVIAKDEKNSGSYTWTPSKSLPAGSDYAIMITSASGEQNYTPLLKIASDVSSTASITLSASNSTITSASSRGFNTTSYHNSTHSATKTSGNFTRKPTTATETEVQTSTASQPAAPSPTAGTAADDNNSGAAVAVGRIFWLALAGVVGLAVYLN